MTLEVGSRNDYIGTGLVDTYAYGFKIFAAADLEVTTRDTDDVETLLAYPADFDVTGVGLDVGGTIVLSAGALANDYAMTIRRVVDLDQETDLRNQQGFFPEVLEDTFDKLTMIDQQQQDQIDRAVSLPVTASTGVSAEMPVPGAGKFIRWSNDGLSLELVSSSPDGGVFTASGSGAVARSWSSKVGEMLSVKDFGAVGDGVTDDTVAFVVCFALSRAVFVPSGTYVLTSFDLPTRCRMYGDGVGLSVLKAKAASGDSYLVRIPNTVTDVLLRDMTIDGNRAAAGLVDATSTVVAIKGVRVVLDNVEVKQGTRYGVFIGDDSILSHGITIRDCYIHDNGGVVNNAGYGCGIGSGGVVTPEDISILDSTIMSNYNTVTRPNDSSGINLVVKGVVIQGCRVVDNFNVAGGQVVVNGVDQTFDINAVIASNHIKNTTTNGTPKDRTCGIEIQGRGFSITGNVLDLTCANGTGIDGIQIGGDATHASGYGTISGNTIDCNGVVSTGISLDPAGLASGITDVAVFGNTVKDASIGINTNAAVRSIAQGNNFSSCTQPQAGTVTATMLMEGNLPYGVANGANGRTHTDAVSVASANNLTLGNSNSNEVSGTTTINLVSSLGWYVGDIVRLYFTNSLTVKDGQASSGNFKKILLAGGADFAATDKDVLVLQWNGVEWVQVSAANNA